MANYYEILGVHSGASFAEIRSAFRRLAKIYHPDKNPLGKEQFAVILKAYETLSDPQLKSTYDYKLNYNRAITQTSSSNSKNSGTKTWSFDEKELKRRKYYEEHIKKYAKTKETYKQETEGKKHYNEFKYILFATPIAVALFLLILHLAAPSGSAPLPQKKTEKIIEVTELKMGDTPYSSYFGRNKYDTASKLNLVIKNNTGLELIACIFTKNKFVRSCYIAQGFYVEISQLPKAPLIIKYCTGNYFSYSYQLKEKDIFGAFKVNPEFYESRNTIELNSINELTLQGGLNEGFKRVSEKRFFKRD
ncbi:MAG: J domain-containing protein [Bacteroidetes bacterium]|nr:J domain-containing protein [Bacteroidota bacterium]